MRICTAAGCGAKHFSKGYCAAHYGRWRRHGDLKFKRCPNGAPFQFLVEHKDRRSDQCLEFPFSRNVHGYGQVSKPGFPKGAHRVMCILVYGRPPFRRAEVAHSCRNKICVNPLHLRWATAAENNEDRARHGTIPLGSAVPGSKLTEADVRAIRASSESNKTLAQRYNVSPQTVWKIRTGHAWCWLTGEKNLRPSRTKKRVRRHSS